MATNKDTIARPPEQTIGESTPSNIYMRLLVLFILAGLLASCGSSRQRRVEQSREDDRRGYQPGYIITLQGDTLTGSIKDRAPEPFVELYSRIRFRKAGRRGKEKLGPWDIRGYQVAGRLYESVPLREESYFLRFRYHTDYGAPLTFLRVIRREGPLTYYHREYIHDDNFYLDFFPLLHLEGDREMVRVTQGILGLKRKALMQYFRECQALVDALAGDTLAHPDDVFDFYLQHCGKFR